MKKRLISSYDEINDTFVGKIDGEDGIAENDFSLNAGRYVGVVIEDDGMTELEFKEKMFTLLSDLNNLSDNSIELKTKINNNLKDLLGD